MMGRKKLATIRDELRQAFAAERRNPIAALDRKLRKLTEHGAATGEAPRSLLLLRNALAQVAEPNPPASQRAAQPKRPKKAI